MKKENFYYSFNKKMNLFEVYSINENESDFLGDELLTSHDTKQEAINYIKWLEEV
ncbi:MAG: hypothetical protein U9N34_07675 [Candidatus Cloacimonadota bacterium]|nr:hypothetical protein [Candidatus Cloacimonadota bacterium]